MLLLKYVGLMNGWSPRDDLHSYGLRHMKLICSIVCINFFKNWKRLSENMKKASSLAAPTFGAVKPLPGQPGYKFVQSFSL